MPVKEPTDKLVWVWGPTNTVNVWTIEGRGLKFNLDFCEVYGPMPYDEAYAMVNLFNAVGEAE